MQSTQISFDFVTEIPCRSPVAPITAGAVAQYHKPTLYHWISTDWLLLWVVVSQGALWSFFKTPSSVSFVWIYCTVSAPVCLHGWQSWVNARCAHWYRVRLNQTKVILLFRCKPMQILTCLTLFTAATDLFSSFLCSILILCVPISSDMTNRDRPIISGQYLAFVNLSALAEDRVYKTNLKEKRSTSINAL